MSCANNILKFSLACMPFNYSRLPVLFCIALVFCYTHLLFFFKASTLREIPPSSFYIPLDMEVFQGGFILGGDRSNRIIIGFKAFLYFTGCEILAVPTLNFCFCQMELLMHCLGLG